MIKKNITKSMTLFILFFTMTLCISLIISNIEKGLNDVGQFNQMISKNDIQFYITDKDKRLTNLDFFNIIKENQDDIVLTSKLAYIIDNVEYSGNGIYFNDAIKKEIPILNGRFLNSNDCENTTPVIVLGKGLIPLTIERDGKTYITINSIEYEVIGTMGYNNKTSLYDDSFYFNLKSIMKDNTLLSKLNVNLWVISSDSNKTADIFNSITKKIQNIDNNISLNRSETPTIENPITAVIEDNMFTLSAIAVLVMTLLVNLINITSIWIHNKRKEIGIRKALGATNSQLIFSTVIEYELIAFIASVFALVTHITISKIGILTNYVEFIYSKDTITIVILSLLLGLISVLISTSKIVKIRPNEIMKGK